MSGFEVVIVASYAAIMALLCVLGVHRLWMLVEFRRAMRREAGRRPPAPPDVLPSVTVQLPLYNERYVAERAIDAAAALDYPSDLLEIQVLDDSDDETCDAVDRAVARAAARGIATRALRRADRTGYKAGALAAGLDAARGELIAVFDADFVVPSDWLRRIVGEFSDPRVGMVQTAWGHLNADESMLTRAQADFLQGHFAVEHRARAGNGHYFNFNGTAGIWRRRAIDDAGGWSADTLTEDLDLSYRAQLAGWRFVYRPDVVVPAELPVELSAYKKQQHRWTKGAIQVAWKLLPRLLTHPGLRVSDRLHAASHLLCNITYPLVLLLAFLLLPMILIRQRHGWVGGGWLDLAVLALATLSVGAFYLIAQRLEGKTAGRAAVRVPLLMAVGIAMTINNARAVLEGALRLHSPFRRTAKYGSEAVMKVSPGDLSRRSAWAGRAYNSPAGPQAWLEAAMALYCLSALGYAVVFAPWGSWPFVAMFAAGFALGAGWSVAQSWQRRQVRGACLGRSNCAPAMSRRETGTASADKRLTRARTRPDPCERKYKRRGAATIGAALLAPGGFHMSESILVSFGGYGVFLVLGAVLITIPIVAGMFLRPLVETKQKRTVYECGEPTIGSSWIRYNIRFYSTALDFLIFDVEVVLLLPASVALLRIGRTVGPEAASVAFLAIGLFVVVLGLGLAYAWRWGSVDWIRGGQTDQALPARPIKRGGTAPTVSDLAEREAA